MVSVWESRKRSALSGTGSAREGCSHPEPGSVKTTLEHGDTHYQKRYKELLTQKFVGI